MVSQASLSEARHTAGPAAVGTRRLWLKSILIAGFVFCIYSANLREIRIGDTVAAKLLPLSILRGDGMSLDRFEPFLRRDQKDHTLPYFVASRREHLVSLYPIAPALLTTPLMIPQMLLLDHYYPGWDHDDDRLFLFCSLMAKNTAALVTALVAVALYWLLNVLGLGRVATGTVLAAALGSELWVVASQSMWQHGPAALALVLTMLLLAPAQPSRGRLLWAGLMTALLVCFRPTNLVFALVIALWVMRYSPRRVLWFGVFPAILGALLLGYNYWFFGSAAGGAVLLESSATHHAMHGVRSAWSGNLLEGLAGTLISPNRGLFIFTPWIPVALAILPWSGARIPAGHLVRWLFWSLLPFLFILSKYSVWWGGYSFGPRYWTDAIPLFAVMLALGLAWAFDHSRILSALLFTGVLLAIVAQVIGAACFPSSWNARPKSVDLHHERLWDWSDTELRRCIHDGVQRPRPAGLSLAAPSRVPPVRQSLVSPAPAKCPVASCSIPMCLCLPAAG